MKGLGRKYFPAPATVLSTGPTAEPRKEPNVTQTPAQSQAILIRLSLHRIKDRFKWLGKDRGKPS